jgi:hypothetical protein
MTGRGPPAGLTPMTGSGDKELKRPLPEAWGDRGAHPGVAGAFVIARTKSEAIQPGQCPQGIASLCSQ